jgi:GlcNAc-P-P-Und epimerase
LQDKKVEVLNYDIEPPRNKTQNKFWIKGNLLDSEKLKSSVESFNPDYIVHSAARTDLNGSTIDDYRVNTVGVSNLIDSLQFSKSLKRILFASSRLVCKIGYQPKSDTDYLPTTAYGESKVLGEKIVRDRAEDIPCPWMIFRPTSIWGPWFDVPYKDFFMMILNGRYVHPSGRKIRKSFGYIGNSIYMIDNFLFCDTNFIHEKTLYLTDYPELEVQDWANLIAKKSGNKPPREVPYFILKLVAFCGDIARSLGWKKPPLTSFRLDNLLTEMLHDTKEVKEICGELPYDLDTGVEKTLEWINNEK